MTFRFSVFLLRALKKQPATSDYFHFVKRSFQFEPTYYSMKLLNRKFKEKRWNRGMLVNKSTKYNWFLLNIADSWRGHDISKTTKNKCTETQIILLHFYTSTKRYNISFVWYFKLKCWFSSGNGTVRKACDCGAKGPRFEPRTLPPIFGRNLGTCTSCERIGKNLKTVI